MTDMHNLIKPGELTGDDLLQLVMGMGERHELIERELKVMSPAGNRHGEVAMNFGYEIKTHAKQHNLGRVLAQRRQDSILVAIQKPCMRPMLLSSVTRKSRRRGYQMVIHTSCPTWW
jgi:hypothetical protein